MKIRGKIDASFTKTDLLFKKKAVLFKSLAPSARAEEKCDHALRPDLEAQLISREQLERELVWTS
jgi:hypothetical protein